MDEERCGVAVDPANMTADPLAGDHPHPTGWTGWIAFGAAMIMLVGTFDMIEGLVVLLDDGYDLTTSGGLAVDMSFTTLGWLQIGLGVVSLAIGVGIFLGATVALVAGVIVTAVSAIAHVATIAANPVWSVVVVAFNVIVIYALVVHGREMTLLRSSLSAPYPGDEEEWIAQARL